MKHLLYLLVLIIPMSILPGCAGESGSETPLPESQYVELNSHGYTQNGILTKKQAKVISSQLDYAAELANYTNVTPTLVDFSKGKVLLIDMGGRSTGGYSISVASINVSENSVTANITLVQPGQNCLVTQALTNPYQFVYIPSLKEILVSEKLEVNHC